MAILKRIGARPTRHNAMLLRSRIRMYKDFDVSKYCALMTAQRYRCSICQRAFSNSLQPCIDHDHDTERVRGLLCQNCNWALGNLRDNPQAAQAVVRYLMDHVPETESPRAHEGTVVTEFILPAVPEAEKSTNERCPKDGYAYKRRWHPPEWRPKPNQRVYFLWWDLCPTCGHVQHYERAKRRVPRST